MFYMVQSQKIKPGNVVIVESVIDQPPILATADQLHVTQTAQLMGNSRLGHLKLNRQVADVPFAVEQKGDDPQTGRVAEGAEQVSQVGRGLIFEQHI